MQRRFRWTPADKCALVLGPVLVLLLFAACLQLLYLRAIDPTGLARPVVAAIDDLPRSSEVMTVACVLLAGLLGGYLQVVRDSFDGWAPDDKVSATSSDPDTEADDWHAKVAGTWFQLLSQLVMGLGTAGVVALFVPLAIGNPPSLGIYNPWGLVMLGVASGYGSRHLFRNLQARIERAFERLEKSAAIDSAAIGSEVAKDVLKALQPPRPVNYEGSVLLGVFDTEGRNCLVVEGSAPSVRLRSNTHYEARVTFAPSQPGASSQTETSAWHQPIHIEDGDEAAKVPFDIRLRTGLVDGVPTDRTIEVDRRASHDLSLPFNTSNVGAEPDDAPAEITVFVYQRNLFCAAPSLTVRWDDPA